MKLLESYASICGVDIKDSKAPDIYEVFYPAPDKYITIQNSSGFESKNYDLWQDVIGYIGDALAKRNIAILQLGDEKSPALNGVTRLCGKTSMAQSNYLIRRAMLHMGNDSCLNYLCAHSNTPLISVYGPTSIPNHSPYHLPEKHFLFDSHRNGLKPSLSMQENPKTINYITPESIAEAIFKVLDLYDGQFSDFVKNKRTVYLGQYYLGQTFEFIPDHVIHSGFSSSNDLIIRGDVSYDESCVVQALLRHKSLLVFKAGVNCEIYKKLLKNIKAISCEIDLETDYNYIKYLKGIGTKVVFYTKDETNVDKIRAKFYADCTVELSKKDTKDDVLKDAKIYAQKEVDLSKGLFLTNKFVLSKGEAFASIEHARRGIKLQTFNEVIDSAAFYEECEKFRIVC